MVDAIVSACRDAHAHAHTHPHAYDSAISGLGKGKDDVDVDAVPFVRNEDIVRSVSFSFPSRFFLFRSVDLALSFLGFGEPFKAWPRQER
jgi:hypothetical protein